ncbi:ferredoxin [Streptomyces sp. NPDC007264]|uniref:ferredoxin n=1 Tax=Streptomyces sp. NPDC007264 TaxID=3364777 RepID=UPI0036DBEC14
MSISLAAARERRRPTHPIPATTRRNEEKAMKITVDRNKCSGHARCNAVAPELFELDDAGYVTLEESEVPPHLEAQARRGVMACPERAVSLS